VKLYDSLSRSIQTFVPDREEIGVYVCGITPYDTTHLGHAFTYTTVDVLVRYLEYSGHKVRYVQNVTDIDDDILRKAKKEGADWLELGNRWTAHYIRDMMALNVRSPDHFPRATDFITEIITSVEALLQAGVAYEVEGSVYFDLNAWPDYGKLSCLTRPEMLHIANERGNIPDDPNKRDPLDFVLWQAQKPDEPAWESPWGLGRPGWHIECSTMASHYLDVPIHIHCGGADLAFPHHENELAQFEPVRPRESFVNLWFHVAMVHYEGEKMSKSLGNLVMIDGLLRSWSPDTLRLTMAKHHYRSPWNYEAAELQEAAQLAEKLVRAITASSREGEFIDPVSHVDAFQAAMGRDLDTPGALSALENMADAILQGGDVAEAQAALRSAGSVLGLRFDAEGPETHVRSGWTEHLERFSG
jgi:cysteinyl-tRNA synthetase